MFWATVDEGVARGIEVSVSPGSYGANNFLTRSTTGRGVA
jgi:hypothetical protein